MKRRLPWNWKDRLVLVQDVNDDDIEYKLRFRDGTTPKGFMKQIGSFYVSKNTIHSEIDKHFQNRGLGFLCYRTILHDLGELRTKYWDASDHARSIWKKLVKCYPYKTEFWSNLLIVKAKGKCSGITIIKAPQ